LYNRKFNRKKLIILTILTPLDENDLSGEAQYDELRLRESTFFI